MFTTNGTFAKVVTNVDRHRRTKKKIFSFVFNLSNQTNRNDFVIFFHFLRVFTNETDQIVYQIQIYKFFVRFLFALKVKLKKL